MKHSGTDDGFTVLELLIALSIATLVFGAAVAALYGGKKALDKVTSEMREDGTTSALMYLSTLIGETGAYSATSNGDESLAGFQGSDNEIAFVSAYTPESQRAGLYEYRLAFSRSDKALRIYQRALRRSPISTESSFNLLSDVRDLSFYFYGAPSPGDKPYWSQTWTSQFRPPQVVEIRFTLGAGVLQKLQIPVVQTR